MTAASPRARPLLLGLAGAVLLGLLLWALRERIPFLQRAGIDYVRIPGGEFEASAPDAISRVPVRRVRVAAFSLGKTEVTVAQFGRFVAATGHRTDAEREGFCLAPDEKGEWEERPGKNWRAPGFPQGGEHPVVCVSWNDAAAFARWAGARLPGEEEWEYAAGNGARHTAYSWGDGLPSAARGGNVADERALRRFPGWRVFAGYDDGHVFTAPVGGYAPNDLGLHDMTGNVQEWCADLAALPVDVPDDGGRFRAARGSSWGDPPFLARVVEHAIAEPGSRNASTGFRVAR